MTINLYTSQETKKLDSLAIRRQKVPAYTLMERASEFSFNVLLNNWPNTKKVFVFCGNGNNAGDGYLIAHLAKEIGLESFIIQASPSSKISGASKKAFELATASKVKKISISGFKKKSLRDSVIVDALLGTGINGTVRSRISKLILEINKKSKNTPVLSVDIPSGICANRGIGLGAHIQADVTATFIGRKRGCFTSIGRTASGNVVFDDLGISSSTKNQIKTNCHLLDMEKNLPKLKNRKGDAHKGDFGHVLVIGGDKGFGGAAILASKAAVLSGSGLVSLATRSIHVEAALSSCPELMVTGIESGQDLEALLTKSTVVVIGPGLGQSAWSEQMLQRTFMEAKSRNLPVVLDADGLNLLSKLKFSTGTPKKMVSTPHPGEAARLLNKEVSEIQKDRFKSVIGLEKKLGSVCVLKGSGSLVCYKKGGEQEIGVCGAGNTGMAKGGMGDVLAGLIGSFISQGLSLVEATETAVDLHSKAADIGSLELGMTITPTDVIRNIRYFLR